jgi:CSLREA domain-containing protein
VGNTKGRSFRELGVALIVAAVAAVMFAVPNSASAADFVVNSLSDGTANPCTTDPDGCTLRDALEAANSNGSATTDQITFSVTGSIFPTIPLPLILTPTTVTGPGASALAIRANSLTSRTWGAIVAAGTEDRIEGITIADSRAVTNSGAGFAKDGAGLLVLDHVVMSGNFGLSGAFSVGPGPARIVNSTFTQNDADGTGGGVAGNGAAIAGNGAAQLEIINSTIAGNSADNNGGGISWNSSLPLTILSSTIADNTAGADNTGTDVGGGIYRASTGVIQIANTLLANNVVGRTTPVQNQCGGAFSSSGYNLRSSADVACTGFTGTGDVVNPNPVIGLLGPNGGPTNTIPLLLGSPAINAGNPATVGGAFPACPATDQRGLPRGSATGVCDIGAFEVQPPPPPVATPAPTSTTSSLAAAIKKCKRKFRKGPKRKKCIKRAKHRAQA